MGFFFGILEKIPAETGSLGFLCVVSFLIIFEYIFSAIDYIKDYYPASYMMIQKVYKELMIMGIVSFAIAMLESSNQIQTGSKYSKEWIYSIDFAHICLFFMALFYVVHACFLVYISISLAIEYHHMYFIDLAYILPKIDMIRKESKWGNFLFSMYYIPFNKLRSVADFKIIHILFREVYSLPMSFNFPVYLTACHEKFCLELLDIGIFSYGTIIVCCVANFILFSILNHYEVGCEAQDENGTHLCTSMITIFISSGYGMVLWAIIVLYLARRADIKLLKRAGVTNLDECFSLLQRKHHSDVERRTAVEKLKLQQRNGHLRRSHSDSSLSNSIRHTMMNMVNTQSGKFRENRELSMRALKHNVEHIKRERHIEKAVFLNRVYDQIFMFRDLFHRIKIYIKSYLPGKEAEKSYRRSKEKSSSEFKLSEHKKSLRLGSTALAATAFASNIGGASRVGSVSSTGTRESVTQLATAGEGGGGGGKRDARKSLVMATKKVIATKKVMKVSEAFKGMQSPAQVQEMKATEEDIAQLKSIQTSVDFSDIYFLKSRKLFFRLVELTVLMNCFWMSLWATNFITLVSHLDNSAVFQIIMVIPFVSMFPLLNAIVRISSKLSAISKLDFEVIERVLEHDENTNHMMGYLREGIDRMSKELHMEREEVIRTMIDELDLMYYPGDDGLDRDMFERMMRLLHVHMSKPQLFHLFNVIDTSQDGRVTVSELIAMVFPTHAEALQRQKDDAALKQAAQDHIAEVITKMEEAEAQDGARRPSRKRSILGSSVGRRQSMNITGPAETAVHILGKFITQPSTMGIMRDNSNPIQRNLSSKLSQKHMRRMSHNIENQQYPSPGARFHDKVVPFEPASTSDRRVDSLMRKGSNSHQPSELQPSNHSNVDRVRSFHVSNEEER